MMPHLTHPAFSSPAPPRHRLQPEASARGRGQRFPLAASNQIAVERYAYQLFLQAADEPARSPLGAARLRGAAMNPQRLPSEAPPIPLAYQLWLAHLLWLEEVLHTLDCRPGDVTAAELAGLQALSRARARFLQEHQFCSRCQAANPRFAQRCRRCAQEL